MKSNINRPFFPVLPLKKLAQFRCTQKKKNGSRHSSGFCKETLSYMYLPGSKPGKPGTYY